ncbi:MAG: LysR family transcriptional regulator [Oscillospiraceae bacterium]|nr:LysR family transcriptional regulator [Oscillospiraceae bacterium]
MTFQQLQYLLEVRQTKSVSKAAANLFVSNSSVSASISSLEDEMGFPIFTRSQKGLVPTEKGLQILNRAERICRIYDEMNNVKNDNMTVFKVSFRSYPPFARAFARLVEENRHRTDILFHSITLLRDEMIRKVANQELELSLISYFSPRVRLLEAKIAKAGLEHRVLKTLPATVQVGPGHRLYNAKSVTPAELENDTIVDSSKKPIVSSDFLHGVMDFKPEKVILCDNSAGTELIKRGLAYSITIMPTEEERSSSIFHYIPLAGVDFQLILVINPERPLSPEGNRFLELLDEELDNI